MLAGMLQPVMAADEKPAEDTYAYYGFEPEIVTNYISNRKKLGFVRISVELMVKDPQDLVALQHHDPLLRAAIVEILGNQPEDRSSRLPAEKRSAVSVTTQSIVCWSRKPVGRWW